MSMVTSKIKGLFLLILFLNLPLAVFAQNESLEITSNSTPGTPSDNRGPVITISSFPFEFNEDNPTGDTFSTFRPTVTATISITNQQFFVTQDTDDDGASNDTDDPATVAGWDFTSGTGFIRTGAKTDVIRSLSDLSLSNPSDGDFTSLPTITSGTGISTANNYAAWLSTSVEGLRGEIIRCGDSDPNCTQNVDNRYQVADLTITFSEPINDPVLHFLGLGGRWFIDIDNGDGTTTRWSNSGTIELDFLSSSSVPSSGISFSKLSGTENFEVDNTNDRIRNNADYPDINNDSTRPEDFGVGSGSVHVVGDNIETLAFRLYMRGINGAEITDNSGTADFDQQIIGSSDLNWAGGSGELSSDEINFSSDTWMLGFSTAVEPDDQLLTTADCFRMLSAPVEGTTYGDLVGDFWIQGRTITGTGVNHTDGTTDPNVFLWPTDGSTGAFSGWDELPNLDATIDPGTGFLISVFEDDDFETGDVQGGFDKTITVTGSENAPPTVSGSANTMNDGADEFSLLGNPFKSTIDWDNIQPGNTLDVRNAVYVFDRAISGYRSYVGDVSGGGGFGSLDGGLIEPFQGFFVQNESTIDAGGPQVDFTGAKAATDGSGSFYGKDQSRNSFVSFELNGESLYNTMWIWFSSNGSIDNTNGDALELTPLAHDYAMMGTRKTDDTIYDIGHYPIPDEQFEIPVSFEATRSGRYTITADEMNLTLGADLYFIDLETEESIRIDENFRYEFTTQGVAEKSANSDLRRCTVGGPQKAKTIASADRFLITTSPKQFESELPESIALNQNFPNPFNPTTQITYQLPQESEVRLDVFDMNGRQVTTLVSGESMSAGTHTVNFDAANLSSGVYMYRLQAGATVLTKKLTLIK